MKLRLLYIDSDQVFRLQISYQNEMKNYDDDILTAKKKISVTGIS